MKITTSPQQKLERLETEKKNIEDRIRQLKRSAQTAERKQMTRAKIILGALVLRDHQPLLKQIVAKASPQDAEVLLAVFPRVAKEVPSLPVSRQ